MSPERRHISMIEQLRWVPLENFDILWQRYARRCAICNRHIMIDGLKCDICAKDFHIACVSVSPEHYERMETDSTWYCSTCRLRLAALRVIDQRANTFARNVNMNIRSIQMSLREINRRFLCDIRREHEVRDPVPDPDEVYLAGLQAVLRDVEDGIDDTEIIDDEVMDADDLFVESWDVGISLDRMNAQMDALEARINSSMINTPNEQHPDGLDNNNIPDY